MGDDTIESLDGETVGETVLAAIQKQQPDTMLSDIRECEGFSGVGVQCYFDAPDYVPVRPVIDMARRNECIEIETMEARRCETGARLSVFLAYYDQRESQTFVPEEELNE